MAKFEVGDRVVFAPHGAGEVIATEHRDDAWGEYLTIRISGSTLTLMVPAAAATDKGVRPVLSSAGVKRILKSLKDDPEPLLDHPQERANRARERIRGGDSDLLAGIIRDYTGLARTGKKLTATELGALTSAKASLASEIALATGDEKDAALAKIELALGNDPA